MFDLHGRHKDVVLAVLFIINQTTICEIQLYLWNPTCVKPNRHSFDIRSPVHVHLHS